MSDKRGMVGSKVVEFHDQTFRDGPQSNWAMGMRYSMMDAVLSEVDQSGMLSIEMTIWIMKQWIICLKVVIYTPIRKTFLNPVAQRLTSISVYI